jgi:hypothetical protein
MDGIGAKETLDSRGWVTLPSIIDDASCRAFLAHMEERWSALGRPPMHSEEDKVFGSEAIVSPVGMVVPRLIDRYPIARELLVPPAVSAIAREILGPGFELEHVTGVMSDETRPFFFWHHHLGGVVHAKDYEKHEVRYPTLDRVERLSCTFYPVPLDDEQGVMLVHPRKVTDPTAPPFGEMGGPWPVQEALRCPAGSVVLMDQSVWHAVTPMQRPGRRGFIAGFLVPARA